MNLGRRLKAIGACDAAIEWVGQRDLLTAWAECERADWMLWLCGHMADRKGWPSRQQIVEVVCDIAESVLPLFEERYPQDPRPRRAIGAARIWARAITPAAAGAACRADAPAWRAAAAAAGAIAAGDAWRAADAAAGAAGAPWRAAAGAAAADAAADAAAWRAAADAADAAWREARAAKQQEMCALVRERLKISGEVIVSSRRKETANV